MAMKNKPGEIVFGAVIGIIVLLLGISWLGNDMNWWSFDFPFWPPGLNSCHLVEAAAVWPATSRSVRLRRV